MFKAMLFGHSFVTGLADHLRNTLFVDNPAKMAHHLKISHYFRECLCSGKRGLLASAINKEQLLSELSDFMPNLLIFELGSNDIVSQVPPLNTASAIIDLANLALSVSSVRHVAICGSLHRSVKGTELFDKIQLFNRILFNFCEVEPKITFHSHQGLALFPTFELSRDSVHPNGKLGRDRYLRSIRRIIFCCLNNLSDQVTVELLPGEFIYFAVRCLDSFTCRIKHLYTSYL